MGEQLQVSIGKTGNDIGLQYLSCLIADHELHSKDQIISDGDKKNIQISFKEMIENQYIFRGIFDYSDQLQSQLQDKFEGLFIDSNSILPEMTQSQEGTFHSNLNNFESQQKTYFADKLRTNIEECDRLTGFNFSHSTYDNSAGAASKVQQIVHDEYPSVLLTSFSIFPNLQCVGAIDIYNVIFSISNLVEVCDLVMMYDYQALGKAIQNIQIPQSIDNYHNIVSETMLQLTCPQRFKGFQNGSLKKLATNLIPFPRVHFLTCSFSPMKNRENLTNQIQNLSLPQNNYFTCQDNNENKYLCQALITRCAENNLIYQEATKSFQNKIEWIDDTFHQVNCSKEHVELGKTLMHVGNLRHLGFNFKAHQELFTAHFRRKTFLHHYTKLGIDEMEFTEAESNVNDLISEYQGGCNCGDYADDYYEEEEDEFY